MSSQHFYHGDHENSIAERSKVKIEIIAKYNQQLRQASLWKKLWLRFKINSEVAHVLRQRLYSDSREIARPRD